MEAMVIHSKRLDIYISQVYGIAVFLHLLLLIIFVAILKSGRQQPLKFAYVNLGTLFGIYGRIWCLGLALQRSFVTQSLSACL